MSAPDTYPNSPLALVAVEARHPETTEPLTAAQVKDLGRKLTKLWPAYKVGQEITIQVSNGVPTNPSVIKFHRWFSRDYTSAVVVKDAAISLETTKYPRWEDVRKLVRIVLDARHEVAPLVGCERIGMRYVNEVRAPGTQTGDWHQWINPSLLGPDVDTPFEMPLREWQALFVYGPTDGRSFALRYGPRDGYAVDPNGDLKRPNAPGSSQFFLLDFDSFWLPTNELPEFHTDELLEICDDLHAPVRSLFEGLITQKLRNEVLTDGLIHA
jgi:uncharacterized protein (TIGR04255 family)